MSTSKRPYRIKVGDTWPPLIATLYDSNDEAINLDSAPEVRFVGKRRDGLDVIGGGDCYIIDANGGVVQYVWAEDDTDQPGAYDCEFEISWSETVKETVPTEGYFQVFVVADKG